MNPRTHTPRLVLSKHVRGTGLNARIAMAVTARVGTMWTAYVFALLTLISLPAVILSGSPVLIVAWVAQTFLQLVLLPIIIVGQNVQQAHNDERATADHETLTALHQMSGQQLDILAGQDRVLAALSAARPVRL